MIQVIIVCFVTILELIKPGKDQRDYYYFMALGHYKLEVNCCLTRNHKIYPICSTVMYFLVQEYEASQSCVDRVLQMEPNNNQAKQLKQLVSKKMRRGRQQPEAISVEHVSHLRRCFSSFLDSVIITLLIQGCP